MEWNEWEGKGNEREGMEGEVECTNRKGKEGKGKVARESGMEWGEGKE